MIIIKKIIQTILVILFLYNCTLTVYADKISQNDKIKAVFIYNFTKYIEWSDDNSSDSFIIGIYGDSNILSTLQTISKKKMVKGRKILIKHFSDIKNLKKCHILFISSQVEETVSNTLLQIKGKNILTIGEIKNFSYDGGMINFLLVNGKIRFEMNLIALHQAGLKASSQLLKLALFVKEKK